MVDSTPQTESEQTPAAASEEPKRQSFFSTNAGKTVIATVAVLVLLVVAGVALFVFFIQGSSTSVEPPAATSGAAGSVSVTVEESAVVSPTEKSLSSTFAFRNLFEPSVDAPAPPTEESDSDEEATTAGSDELVLVSIQTTDGELTATFSWEGTEYTVAEGEQLGSTPWEVVDISSDSASVIYGDSSAIELTVGSGVNK